MVGSDEGNERSGGLKGRELDIMAPLLYKVEPFEDMSMFLFLSGDVYPER